MIRTAEDLERAAAAAGAVLLSTEMVRLRDGSWTISGRFGFDDPWAAARLLCILREEDRDDPDVQAWARLIWDETARAHGIDPRDPRVADAFLEAVHENVKHWIAFAPEEGEQFQSARTTMIEGVGDCDCHAGLVHALVRAASLPSEIRFFEQDDEPVHAVAAIGALGHWAETTIDADYGEHPQAAYQRLGLEAGDRPDIGFLGLEFVTPSDVETRKAELDGYVKSLSADVAGCAKIDAPTRASFGEFQTGWAEFMRDAAGWFNSGAQGRQVAEYADAIRDWQAKIATYCAVSAPTVEKPAQDQTMALVKTVAITVGLVAGAVVVVKLLDLTRTLAPRRAPAAA
jgi:hypothetical protein